MEREHLDTKEQKLYNELPESTYNRKSVNSFIKSYKQNILRNY